MSVEAPYSSIMLSSGASGSASRPSTSTSAVWSVMSAVFNLCGATLGAGALALPYSFSRAGVHWSAVLLVVAAICTCFSINLLVYASDKVGHRSYEGLALALMGKSYERLVEVSIIIFCLGTCVAYIVAVGDVLNSGLSGFLPTYLSGNWGMAFLTLAIMTPLSTMEGVQQLRFTSAAGVVSILFLVFATVRHSLMDGALESDGSGQLSTFSGILEASPVIMFAFTNQVNVFSIYLSLKPRTPSRMNVSALASSAVTLISYMLVGTFGYLDFGKLTQPNILVNYCIREDPQPVMVAAVCCMACTIVVAFPLNVLPMRDSIEIMCSGRHHSGEPLEEGDDDEGASFSASKLRSSELPHSASQEEEPLLHSTTEPASIASTTTRRVCLTCTITFLSLALAILTPNISLVFQLTGGLTSSIISFILPAVFALKTGYGSSSTWRRLATWTLGVSGAVLGVLTTAAAVNDVFKGSPDQDEFQCKR